MIFEGRCDAEQGDKPAEKPDDSLLGGEEKDKYEKYPVATPPKPADKPKK